MKSKTNETIRKVVAGRMDVKISRECGYKPGYKFVQLYYSGKIGKEKNPTMEAVRQDLIKAGFEAEQGHYINELSFFAVK